MKMLSANKLPPAFEELVEHASQRLVIITPYFEPWSHLTAMLYQKLERKIPMFLLLRGGEDRAKREASVLPFQQRGAQVTFLDRLHAKIYFSEHQALLTSMNLLGASRDSWEVGTLFDAAGDAASYSQIVAIAMDLFKTVSITAPHENSASVTQRASAPRRTVRGHCIRCSSTINAEPQKPFCRDCYSSWAEWENDDYPEKFCHLCGRQWSSSMAKPLCRGCWEHSARA